jgi:hypothetical protein
MARGLTLDSGALIAAENGDRFFWALWKKALDRSAPLTVPAAVLAQVWRGNSPVVARLLSACKVDVLDEREAKRVGILLAASRGRSDIVDGAVVVGAARRGDAIVTSDPHDIKALVAAAAATITVMKV